MRARTDQAATAATAQSKSTSVSYGMRPERVSAIAERLRQMPSKYRATYRRAVKGRSLRACVNAFCQECCGWQSREVADCTDLGCPLYRVRPYQDDPGSGRDERFTGVEGPNGTERVE